MIPPAQEVVMILYLRCCIANKALLAAYCIVVACLVRIWFAFSNYLPLSKDGWDTSEGWLAIGLTIAFMTKFGRDTVGSYRRTLEQIENYGFNERIASIRYRWYCDRAGHRLAIQTWKRQQRKRPHL